MGKHDSDHLQELLEPARLMTLYMGLPFLGCCSGEPAATSRRSFQERKLQMLMHWRDAAERQVAALDGAISTLKQQMERDATAGS